MKKRGFAAIILVVSVVLGSFVSPIASLKAAEPIKVTVNGKAVDFPDAQPFKDKNGRIQVPVRFVSKGQT